jgi:hypothetical protein
LNLCGEPLLKAIRKNEAVHGAYVEVLEGKVKFDVQAHADDVGFISESQDGIKHMLEILEEYTQWSKMEINLEKCAIASYFYDEDKRLTYSDNNVRFRGEAIPNLTTAESMRHLGAPITARRTVKLKTVKLKLDEMNILLGQIMSSPLLTVQKIDAVKIFLSSSTDFLLLNGEAGGTQR